MTIRVPLLLALRTGVFAFLAADHAGAQTQVTFKLTKSCDSGSAAVAMLRGSDNVKVRYSFAGDAGTCYAVTATVDGNSVDGYLIGAAHPDLAAFEQEVRTKAVLIPQAPPPPPPAAIPAAPAKSEASAPAAKEAPPAPELPLSFAGFRAVDINGDRVDLNGRRAANIVVYFWSARSERAVQSLDAINALYDTYHARGVDMVGIASGATTSRLIDISRDHEFVWSQVSDSGGIAARYHVDPARPFLVLDQSRNVIAAVPTAIALGPILDQLTKNRRPRS
jgi:AhpC/TSA family